MLTVSLVTPVRSGRPVAARNCAAVITKFADREAPLVATSPPGCTFACDRKMPLISTSSFGMGYDARPRTVVIQGSPALHADCPSITPDAATVAVLGVIGRPYRPTSTAHVSL